MAQTANSVAEEYAAYADDLIAQGAFSSREEVLAAATDALRLQFAEDRAQHRFIEKALEEAEASGVYEGDVIAEIYEKHGWSR